MDVRGSTTLAESMRPTDFSQLMNRFYAVATDVMVKTDALIDKLVGDEVIGLYLPGWAGPNHARLAVKAARDLLHATGHGTPHGPWLPVGVGVHTGIAFVGTVSGTEGTVTDLTALGDTVNIAARLASTAGPGEALISHATYAAAGVDLGDLEQRQLELKGKSQPIGVHVLRASVFSYYIYYRVDPAKAAACETRIRELLASVRKATGIEGRLMKKRGEPNHWMEVYENVAEEAKFEWELADAVARLKVQEFLLPNTPRHVECFENP